eukprot:XP_001704615.1 Hypothetical protein GL50803_9703 [Giardia lamblia ATCC 50803]
MLKLGHGVRVGVLCLETRSIAVYGDLHIICQSCHVHTINLSQAARAPIYHSWHRADPSNSFYGVVRTSVFTKEEAVVGKNMNGRDFAKCSVTNSCTAVAKEHQEGCIEGDKPTVRTNTIRYRCHRVLANTIIDIIAALSEAISDRCKCANLCEVRGSKIRTANKHRVSKHMGSEEVQNLLAHLTRSQALPHVCCNELFIFMICLRKQLTKSAVLKALEAAFNGDAYIWSKALKNIFGPLSVCSLFLCYDGLKVIANFVRDMELQVRVDTDKLLELTGALSQRSSVDSSGTLLGGSIPYSCLDDDQGRTTQETRVCLANDTSELLQTSVSILHLKNLPPVCLVAACHVFREADRSFTVYRDSIIIIKNDQIIKLQAPCKAGCFRTDALLKTTIANDANNLIGEDARILRSSALGGQSHANGAPDALAKSTRRYLNPTRDVSLRMTRCVTAKLAEVTKIIHRKVIPK